MRLIDADKLRESMCRQCNVECSDDPCEPSDCEHMRIIDSQPTIDAVEVVQCKDCEHWHKETGWCYHHSHFIDSEGGACHPWESCSWKMLQDDDFCSYGERRTYETD